jgi:chromosomal replication initiator protein
MTMQECWAEVCRLLRQEMNGISYSTWIESSLTPILLTNEKLCLAASTEFIKTTVSSRYAVLIGNAVSQVLGKNMRVEIYTQQEAESLSLPVDSKKAIAAGSMPVISLNPKYTFENFVVGNGNRFAHAAALAVAESPGQAYNPLFLYGGVGLGKTHLMHAIGHFAHKEHPNLKLLYITCEDFTNEIINSMQTRKTEEMRNRFRNVDVLMIDDVQFLAGKTSTQEEFFHTFNALHSAGKQIILTSDRPPKEISRLEERLQSRFEWGLIADIQKPDLETRIAILRQKANDEHLSIDDSVLSMIAERVDSNIRELEGSLTRLTAYSALVCRPITPELAEEALREIFDLRKPKKVTCELVIETVADYYSLTVDDLKSGRRTREIAVPRQIAMYLARELTGFSYPVIAERFGNRHYSTVMHDCDKIANLLTSDSSTKSAVDDLKKMITER